MTGPFEVIFSTRGGKGAFFFLMMMAMIAVAAAGLEVGPICDSDLDCLDGWMEGTYCAGGECLEYSQCKTDSDCFNPSNIYGKIECVGYVECQVDGTCGVVCGSQCKDGSDWVNCFVDPCDIGGVDSSTTRSSSSTTTTRNIDPSVCGSPADSCMNDSNYGQCVGLINDGCQQLMIMESCPLQFACGDQDQDVAYCENLLATDANCMNDDNYNDCVSLVVNQGCQNVASLESCPLQFSCEDDIQDDQDSTGALCDGVELQASVSCVADYCGGCHARHFDSKGSLLCADAEETTSTEDTDDPLPCDEASNSNHCTKTSQYCASNGFCADYYSCVDDSDCSNVDNFMNLPSNECSTDSGVECQDGTCKTYYKDNSESPAVAALQFKAWMLLVTALIVGVATID